MEEEYNEFEKYTPEQELEARNEEIKYLRKELKDYKEVLFFLVNSLDGNPTRIIEAIAEQDYFEIIGEVEGKPVTKSNELFIEAEVPDLTWREKKTKYLFDWQHFDNYAVYQRTEFEDSYYGYMLFPSRFPTKFLCVFYRC